ncbi:GNAT family N-acetyltransferase [Rhizobium sp. KVB221]|uniref:GNAT family N-acetyltransferase n=1 Tax=Rhizobium setariae TaxID=2801340 RepID=A0A936YLT7_9HYPH|nr:GNAT family N-acetyltransferase [Rhizobium setariae]MBL0372854.1 GNAT family N-acetyltransferase [Rhizobium setariae]
MKIPAPAKKPKALKAHITQLEMAAPPRQSLPLPVNLQTAVMSVSDIPLTFYRFLYTQVGRRWHWVDRLRMTDDKLLSILRDKRTRIAVLYVNGAPAGFCELFVESEEVVELSHFGLFEHALGLGVGKWFLLQSLYAAWALEPKKVTVTTNSLDHPRALQLYQMFGFNPVGTSDALVRPLSDEEWLALLHRS